MSSVALTRIIDQACGPVWARIEQHRPPRRILVHPEAFEVIAALRRQEIVDGLPLMLLGLELAPADNVPLHGFTLED